MEKDPILPVEQRSIRYLLLFGDENENHATLESKANPSGELMREQSSTTDGE